LNIVIVQTGAIGDIVIALPIAHWYYKKGHRVFWPVDSTFISFLTYAAPYVNFLTVDVHHFPKNTYNYFIGAPLAYASQLKADKTFILYSQMGGYQLEHRDIATSLKFDEYKYAVTEVPFREKWNLQIRRNEEGEKNLLQRLDNKRPFCILHERGGEGSNFHKALAHLYDPSTFGNHVFIENLTSSPFDWIAAFEQAKTIAVIDSLHANVIEQLKINTTKYLHTRSPALFTPVFMEGWHFRG